MNMNSSPRIHCLYSYLFDSIVNRCLAPGDGVPVVQMSTAVPAAGAGVCIDRHTARAAASRKTCSGMSVVLWQVAVVKKQKAPQVRGSYFCEPVQFLRRRRPATPSNPSPSNARDVGSGTVLGSPRLAMWVEPVAFRPFAAKRTKPWASLNTTL